MPVSFGTGDAPLFQCTNASFCLVQFSLSPFTSYQEEGFEGIFKKREFWRLNDWSGISLKWLWLSGGFSIKNLHRWQRIHCTHFQTNPSSSHSYKVATGGMSALCKQTERIHWCWRSKVAIQQFRVKSLQQHANRIANGYSEPCKYLETKKRLAQITATVYSSAVTDTQQVNKSNCNRNVKKVYIVKMLISKWYYRQHFHGVLFLKLSLLRQYSSSYVYDSFFRLAFTQNSICIVTACAVTIWWQQRKNFALEKKYSKQYTEIVHSNDKIIRHISRKCHRSTFKIEWKMMKIANTACVSIWADESGACCAYVTSLKFCKAKNNQSNRARICGAQSPKTNCFVWLGCCCYRDAIFPLGLSNRINGTGWLD